MENGQWGMAAEWQVEDEPSLRKRSSQTRLGGHENGLHRSRRRIQSAHTGAPMCPGSVKYHHKVQTKSTQQKQRATRKKNHEIDALHCIGVVQFTITYKVRARRDVGWHRVPLPVPRPNSVRIPHGRKHATGQSQHNHNSQLQ